MRYFLIAAGVAGLIAAGSARAAIIFDTGGFEGYSAGNIVGQNGWVDAGNSEGLPAGQYSPNAHNAQIVTGPGGSGNVLQFDNIDKTYQAVQRPFANVVGVDRYAKATFDYFREDKTIYNNLDWWPMGSNPYYGLAWDNAASAPGQILPFGFGNGQAPQSPDRWNHVELVWDLQTGKGNAWFNGTQIATDANIGTGAEYNGWLFDDWQTVDQNRTPNQLGRKVYVDNLVITAGNSTAELNPVPEPGSLALLAGGLLPLLGLRRRK